MKKILITKDSKGKFREVEFELIENTEPTSFTIKRRSGLVGGKLTEQPELNILEGKVKRTVKEQAELQFNSLIKKQLDKGYKDFELLEDAELTQDSLAKVMPETVTDQNGISKPMLCKVFDFNDKKNLGKSWLISRKLDGVRCFLYYKDGEVHTKSRGGQDYDIAANYIINDPYVKQLFENYPDLILDGELYKHGWPLSKISGLCRLDHVVEEHLQLGFHCYDIADEKLIFRKRAEFLTRESFKSNSNKIVPVAHYEIELDENTDLKTAIMAYHDQFIAEGYEGAVVRDADEKYKFGARDRRMQKIKLFTDDEFEILDIVEGLREEDMCFLMKTKDGNEFKAKPIGDRSLKQYYRDHKEELIGRFGTVKYFGYTTTGSPVPNLPVFKSLRDSKDA